MRPREGPQRVVALPGIGVGVVVDRGDKKMTDQLVWHRVYGKPTLFEAGVAVGDVYPSRGADAEVWRCRLWSENRLQGGREKLVLASAGEETAKEALLRMLAVARGEAG